MDRCGRVSRWRRRSGGMGCGLPQPGQAGEPGGPQPPEDAREPIGAHPHDRSRAKRGNKTHHGGDWGSQRPCLAARVTGAPATEQVWLCWGGR